VIIVSTVRSSPDLVLTHDAKFNLGFLKNEKRLNVAITRPQALLIIVGSPSVLYHDPNWKYLIDYCIESGAYRGDQPPPADPSLYFKEVELGGAQATEGVSDALLGRDD
jgi:helicase MOV-10